MTTHAAHATLDGDELIATRHLDAEPALVWEMFTTPEHVATFWGGDHAEIAPASVVIDLRVGGTFEMDARGADGGGRRLSFRYEAVEAPARLVLVEPHSGLTTEIVLRPSGSGTTVVIHQRRLPPELRTEQARAGLAAILDRLDAVIGQRVGDERRSCT